MLRALGSLVSGRVRLWRAEDGSVPQQAGLVETVDGPAWLQPVPGAAGVWLEIGGAELSGLAATAQRIAPVVAALLDSERQRAHVAEELAGRYEEIDLLYAISEILGRTVRLDEAAQIIVQEVSAVVGARRGSIMVYE